MSIFIVRIRRKTSANFETVLFSPLSPPDRAAELTNYGHKLVSGLGQFREKRFKFFCCF